MATGGSALGPNAAQLAQQDPTFQQLQAGAGAQAAVTAAAVAAGVARQQLSQLQQARQQEADRTRTTAVLSKKRIQDLVQEIDNSQKIDDDVQEVLVDIANDFIERVVGSACQLAKHRGSETLEAKDVQLHLERNWNLRVPGFGRDEIRPAKVARQSEAAKKAMSAVQRDANQYAARRRRLEQRKDTRTDDGGAGAAAASAAAHTAGASENSAAASAVTTTTTSSTFSAGAAAHTAAMTPASTPAAAAATSGAFSHGLPAAVPASLSNAATPHAAHTPGGGAAGGPALPFGGAEY